MGSTRLVRSASFLRGKLPVTFFVGSCLAVYPGCFLGCASGFVYWKAGIAVVSGS